MKTEYNNEIDSLTEYALKWDDAAESGKQIGFVAMLGVPDNYEKEILRMDELIASKKRPEDYYRRMGQIFSHLAPAQSAFYITAYDKWDQSGKTQLRIQATEDNSDEFSSLLNNLCLDAEKLFVENTPSGSDSMKKNFMVKVMAGLDYVFANEQFCYSKQGRIKIVLQNIEKKQEILFAYLLTSIGADVLLLQNRSEPVRVTVSDRLHIVRLGILKEFVFPKWKPVEAKQIQETEILHAAVQNKPAEDKPIRMVVPPHPLRAKTETLQPVKTSAGQGKPAVSVPAREQRVPVVSVKQERKVKSYEELAQLASSVVMITIHDGEGKRIGSGSGIMIGQGGYILTNNHVACGGRFYRVQIEDDEQVYETDEVIKYNPLLDLAIIRIQRQLNVLPIYKEKEALVRGQKVVAIGSPLGLFNSVSDGIIAGFRKINDVDMIQFTAPISHGSSGGAVLNLYGEVIGISTAGFDDGQNINLAVGYENISAFVRGFV